MRKIAINNFVEILKEADFDYTRSQIQGGVELGKNILGIKDASDPVIAKASKRYTLFQQNSLRILKEMQGDLKEFTKQNPQIAREIDYLISGIRTPTTPQVNITEGAYERLRAYLVSLPLRRQGKDPSLLQAQTLIKMYQTKLSNEAFDYAVDMGELLGINKTLKTKQYQDPIVLGQILTRISQTYNSYPDWVNIFYNTRDRLQRLSTILTSPRQETQSTTQIQPGKVYPSNIVYSRGSDEVPGKEEPVEPPIQPSEPQRRKRRKHPQYIQQAVQILKKNPQDLTQSDKMFLKWILKHPNVQTFVYKKLRNRINDVLIPKEEQFGILVEKLLDGDIDY